MTVLAVEPKNAGTAVKPVFAGLACWLDAVVLVIGPLLQVVVFLPETDARDTTARVAFWVAQSARIGLVMGSGLLAVPFLLGGSAILGALARVASRRLAWMGGILAK